MRKFGDWSVGRLGIEHANGYFISTDRLGEIRRYLGVPVSDWLLHLAEKQWANLDDFCEALRFAVEMTESKVDFDIENSWRIARKERKFSELYDAVHAEFFHGGPQIRSIEIIESQHRTVMAEIRRLARGDGTITEAELEAEYAEAARDGRDCAA